MAFMEFFRSKAAPAEEEKSVEAEASAERKEEEQKFGGEVMTAIDREAQQLIERIAALEKQRNKLSNGKKGDARTQKKHAKQISELDAQISTYKEKLKRTPADVVKRYESKLSVEELDDLRTEYGLNDEKEGDVEREAEEAQMAGDAAADAGAETKVEETAGVPIAEGGVEEATGVEDQNKEATEEGEQEVADGAAEENSQSAAAEKTEEVQATTDNISEVIARMERQVRNLEKRQGVVAGVLGKRRAPRGETKASLREKVRELGQQIEAARGKVLVFRKQAASGMLDDLNPAAGETMSAQMPDADVAASDAEKVEPASEEKMRLILDEHLSDSEKKLLARLQEREQTRSVQIQIDALKQYAQNRAARAEEKRNEPEKDLTEVEQKQKQDEKEVTILRADRQLKSAMALAKQYRQQLDNMGKSAAGNPQYEKMQELWLREEDRIRNLRETMREANDGNDLPDETIDSYKANSAKVWDTAEYKREQEKQRAAELRGQFNKEPKIKAALGNVKRRALAGIAALIMAATLAGCNVGDVQGAGVGKLGKNIETADFAGGVDPGFSNKFEGMGEVNEYEQAFENGFTQDLSDFMSDKKTEGEYAFGENWSDLEGDVEGVIERFTNSLDSPLRLTSDLSCYPEIMAKCGFTEDMSGREMLETMYNSPNGGAIQEVAKRELERIYRSQDGYQTTVTFFRGTEGDRIISDWGTVGDFTDENGNIVKTVDGRNGLKATYHDYSVIEVDSDDVFVRFETVLLDKDGNVIGHWVKENKLNCNQKSKKVSKETPLTPYGPNGNPEKEPEQGNPNQGIPPETAPPATTNPPKTETPPKGEPGGPKEEMPPEESNLPEGLPPETTKPPVVEKEDTSKNAENLINKANLGKGENNVLDKTQNLDTMTNEEKTNVGDGQINRGDITGDLTGTYEETTDPTVNIKGDNQQVKEENKVDNSNLTPEEQEKVDQAVKETQDKADEMKKPENRPQAPSEIDDFYQQLVENYDNVGTETDASKTAGSDADTSTGGGAAETTGSGAVTGQDNPVDLGGGNLGGNLGGAGNSGLGEATGEPGV